MTVALVGSCIGAMCWTYFTDSNASRLFEFGIWTGLVTMLPGLLVATGASENTHEEGEIYDVTKYSAQKEERVSGSLPSLSTCVLAGLLIIALVALIEYTLYPFVLSGT